MNWHWAPHVHAAMHGDDLVLLDALRNDYVVLPQAKDLIRLEPSGVGAQLFDEDLARELTEAGLGVSGQSGPQVSRVQAPAAEADLYDDPDPPVSTAAAAGLALLSARVSTHLRWSSLSRVIARPAVIDGGEGEVRRKAIALRVALPWLPFQGECLYRAALLRAHLGDLAGRTHWVFGVSTWPFAAHCWVQLDGLVLNDRLQRVRRYTPILAV
ncbi:MAG: lasso peptide biosynthesis B2 protein [Caulobacter sp.]|nr:lasso peptide biosynthesis B2 protein [Caulobacter sp.]